VFSIEASGREMSRPHVVLIVAVLAGSGCATMISGKTQTISVASDPSGAQVTAQPGGFRATTPGALTLKRLASGYRLRFEKEGYASVDVRLRSSTNGWVWGNLLIGGLIGIAVDYGNGSAYVMSPRTVEAHLEARGDDVGRVSSDTLYVFDRDGGLLVTIALAE